METDSPYLAELAGPVQPLGPSFYDRPTLEVAPELIGKLLVHRCRDGDLVGLVVEVEAYTGDDPAFHAWGIVDAPTGLVKPSGRGYALFGPPGSAYVYLCYGMYWMLNVVTEREGIAGCVLVRAVEPLQGHVAMWERRHAARRDIDLANGPGKLSQAFDIDKRFHTEMLTQEPLFFADVEHGRHLNVRTSSRIGITRAVDRQWRYFVADSPYVSPGRPSDEAARDKRARRRRTKR